MVPAYDRRINLTRSGSYAGIFWVNICMMIAIGIDDSNNLTSTIAAGVGCPLFIALGVFITDRRIKYLCNPRLLDVSSNSDDIVTKAPSKKPSKKGVKWDKPKSQELLKNALYARLKFPTDVEIAARFVLQERPNAALIEKAKTVYHTGMAKFPKSPTVLMAYTNFIFTTAGDWQLGYSTLEKLRKMHPFLDISFFIYRYDKDREQRIEGGNNNIGDYVDFMEYKKLMKAAKQYHHMALVCIRKFWRYLLDSKIDVLQLSNLSSKIAFAEKKATENYTKLLARYPKNIRVLRDYARFLDEVVSDEKLAQKFWRKADKYEEREMEKLTESHRSANNHHDPESYHEEEEDKHSEDRSSHASDYSGDDKTISTTSSGVKSALEVAKLDKNSNLKKLGWIMFFTTLFAMVVMFTQLGVLHRQLGRFEAVVFTLDGAGGASHTGIRAVGQALDFFMYNSLLVRGVFNTSSEFAFMPKGWDYNQFSITLVRNFNLMGNNVKYLYWGETNAMPFTTFRRFNLRKMDGHKMWIDPRDRSMSYDDFDHKAFNKGKVQAYFETPKWNQTMMVDTSGYDVSRSSYATDLWSFSFLTASCGDQLGAITPEGFRRGDIKLFEFTFAIENTEELATALRGLMDLYSDMIISELNNLSIAIIAIFVAAVVLLLLTSVVFFMPVVNSIFQYKFRTFYIFTLIPSSVVKHMIKKKISSLGNEASENEDDEDHYNNNVAKLGTHNKFGTWKEEGEQSDNESAEEPTVKARLATPRFGSDIEKDKLLPSVDEISSTAQLTQVAINVSNNINKDEDTNEKEDEPGSQPSYIQQIKNKIWLKLPANKFTKLPQNEKNEEEEQKQEKRYSRMNASSLKKVTRKLHFSYAVAIACLIIALMVAFITLTSEFKTLNGISKDLKNSDIRTQYAHLVLYDIELLAIYAKTDPVAIRAASRIGEHIELLWNIHKEINAPAFQMNILYGNGCYRINQTLCPQSIADYPYYDLINKGVEFTFMQYVTTAVSLQRQYSIDGYLNYTDPLYLKFRSIAENDIMDGLERLTYTFQIHAADQISSAKLRVGIITGVVCVAFVAIHIIIFKPFVRKLQEESEHTFSIIRMIPRKMLTDVAEIQEFIQESIEAADKD